MSTPIEDVIEAIQAREFLRHLGYIVIDPDDLAVTMRIAETLSSLSPTPVLGWSRHAATAIVEDLKGYPC